MNSHNAIDYEAFRDEVRQFALTQCPAELRQEVINLKKLGRVEMCGWQKILFKHGWGGPAWPKEYGGTGWDLRQRHIFEEIMAECDCPSQPYSGLDHIAPIIMEYGTNDQKAKYLPPTLSGDMYWCQGYSEPGAGSDLASLQTRADRIDNDYVVNGQKLWTSFAHEADMMYALVRTSKEARKQDGITMLLIAMDTPGLVVRPVNIIDGVYKVNEVFFDNVRVPVENRVGEESKGWSLGKVLLSHERLKGANVAPLLRHLNRTRQMVIEEFSDSQGDRALSESLQRRLLSAEAELMGIRELGHKAIDDIINKRPAKMAASIVKLLSSQLAQTLDEIGLDAKGARFAQRFRTVNTNSEYSEEPGVEWLRSFLFGRARTIFGGSQEVQKNVIARNLFGA